MSSIRSMWSGTLNFGLISMPVKLYTAVNSKTVRFNQLHAQDGVRIENKRYCPAHEEEIAFDEIVRGYEIGPDRYITLADEELEALAPEKSRTIEIQDFADLGEIDPIYFDTPYYIAPNTGGAKSYRLLLEAMRDTSKIAIGKVVLRSRERLVTVRPYDNSLLLATLIFGDELRPLGDVVEPADDVEIVDRELAAACQLVESLAQPFEVTKYHDTYREEVLALIERKASGEEIVVQPPPRPAAQATPDLMSALEASLADVRKRGGTNGRARSKSNGATTPSAVARAKGSDSGGGKVTAPRRGGRRANDSHNQRRR
jgi:DNA end-binding protein Ku